MFPSTFASRLDFHLKWCSANSETEFICALRLFSSSSGFPGRARTKLRDWKRENQERPTRDYRSATNAYFHPTMKQLFVWFIKCQKIKKGKLPSQVPEAHCHVWQLLVQRTQQQSVYSIRQRMLETHNVFWQFCWINVFSNRSDCRTFLQNQLRTNFSLRRCFVWEARKCWISSYTRIRSKMTGYLSSQSKCSRVNFAHCFGLKESNLN